MASPYPLLPDGDAWRPAAAPSRAAEVCVERSAAPTLLVYGLVLMALMGGLPALLVWTRAPDVGLAIAAFTGSAGATFAILVLLTRQEWTRTVVRVTGEGLEVRRPRLRAERAAFGEIRRATWGPLGLTVWLASGRSVWAGRLGAHGARVLAALEARSGVPIDGWEAEPAAWAADHGEVGRGAS